jgi:hypothetical protein
MGTHYQTQQSADATAVMRQLTKKTARAMKRARVDRATMTAKVTSVTATMVAAMMAKSAKLHNNQLRGSDTSNSKGDKEDEGGKGNGDGSYGEDVDERDHGGSNDNKHGDKDSTSPRSTTINPRQQWDQQEQ